MTDSGLSDIHRTEGEPHDRLTRLCAAMTDALDQHPERGAEKAIVFLQDADRGVLIHMRAIMRANGKDLQIHALGGDG